MRAFQRFGTLNALSHNLITMTCDTYFAAESMCSPLDQRVALQRVALFTDLLDNANQKFVIVT